MHGTSCFTVEPPGPFPVKTLTSVCGVVAGDAAVEPDTPMQQCMAVWDTGAEATCISARIVEALGLKPIGLSKVLGVGGESHAHVYLIHLVLPCNVVLRAMPVACVSFSGGDVLVGMDVIAQGEFTVSTTRERGTVMTFRTPALKCTDYVTEHEEWERRQAPRRVPGAGGFSGGHGKTRDGKRKKRKR